MPRKPPDLAKLALRILKVKNRATAGYKLADKLMERLLQHCFCGAIITLPDGQQVTVKDNYLDKDGKTKNTAFKAVSFKRFDLVDVK